MEGDSSIAAGPIAARLLVVLLLVAASALLVAAEHALASVRRDRLEALIGGGDRRAARLRDAVARLGQHRTGTQLGLSLAALGLGWVGAPAVAALLDPLLLRGGLVPAAERALHGAALAIGFLLVVGLHAVFGVLVPRALATREPERVGRWVAGPVLLVTGVLRPAVALLDVLAHAALRGLGAGTADQDGDGRPDDELRRLVGQARTRGLLDATDSAMLDGILDFHAKRARDVMRPRTEVAALAVDATAEEVWETLRVERYSRYPVYRESLDDIVGVFLAKDLWLYDGRSPFRLADFVRQALLVPDSRPAALVLDDLRRTRAHMAIVLDEHGGTAGILTMEDLVEQVIGDIADEHDPASRVAVEVDGVLELAGTLSLVDVRSDYALSIPDGDWSTLGGFVFSRLGRPPRIGDRVAYPGGELEVVAVDGRRVAAVRVHRRAEPPVLAGAGGASVVGGAGSTGSAGRLAGRGA